MLLGACPGKLRAMTLFLDSFWRAAAYCLHPRVIALSFLPLLLMLALSLGLGYLYWDAAVNWVLLRLESWNLLQRDAVDLAGEEVLGPVAGLDHGLDDSIAVDAGEPFRGANGHAGRVDGRPSASAVEPRAATAGRADPGSRTRAGPRECRTRPPAE